MQSRARHEQIPVKLILLTEPYLWSDNVNYRQCCWWHHVLLR